MIKKILTGALAVAALALTFSVAAPQTADARIVCHSGWGWHAGRCVRIHRVHYVPRHWHRWHHRGYYDRGYYHDRGYDNDHGYYGYNR